MAIDQQSNRSGRRGQQNNFGPIGVSSEHGSLNTHMGNSYVENLYYINDYKHLWGVSKTISTPRDYNRLWKGSKTISTPRDYNAINEKAKVIYLSKRKILELPTLPRQQFAAQVKEEMRQLWLTMSERALAQILVKEKWVEQGIWNDSWDAEEPFSWRWAHEEPPKNGMQDPEMDSRRDASRPLYQFMYQLRKVYDEMEAKVRPWKVPVDVMTRAAEDVKERWTKQGIWTQEWGIYPGMVWMHEDYTTQLSSIPRRPSFPPEETPPFPLSDTETDDITPALKNRYPYINPHPTSSRVTRMGRKNPQSDEFAQPSISLWRLGTLGTFIAPIACLALLTSLFMYASPTNRQKVTEGVLSRLT